MEVTDLDNNSIKESVDFSEPSFRTNFTESLGSRFGIPLQNSHFLLEVTSNLSCGSSLQNAEEESLFPVLLLLCSVVCFCLRKWSAIYSAPGGVKVSEPNRTVVRSEPLQRFVSDSNRPTVRGGLLTAVALGCSDPDGGAGMIRGNPYL